MHRKRPLKKKSRKADPPSAVAPSVLNYDSEVLSALSRLSDHAGVAQIRPWAICRRGGALTTLLVNDGEILIGSFRTDPMARGRRNASSLMKDIVGVADSFGRTLKSAGVREVDPDPGLATSAIQAWLRRLGFVPFEGGFRRDPQVLQIRRRAS